MKRKTVIFALIFCVLGGIFLAFFGNPLTRIQSKELVIEYLQITYPEEEYTVDQVSYYPFERTYVVHYSSKDGKVQDNIDVKNGEVVKKE